jgi:hypothetical protein
MKKTKAPIKIPRTEQWKINALARRKRALEGGGRLLFTLLEKEHSDKLDAVIELRSKANPSINMTSWVRLMIEADLKLLQRRRDTTTGARSK